MTSFLLQHPPISVGEGPNAYLMRLSEANVIKFNDLNRIGVRIDKKFLRSMCCGDSTFDCTIGPYIDRLQTALEKQPSIWNRQSCRFCPQCLMEEVCWRVGWELLFFDACPTHGCWLVDRCDRCGGDITWAREKSDLCDCGNRLANHRAADAPANVVALAHVLNDKFMGCPESGRIPVLKALSFEQSTRLIRFLGAYGDSTAIHRPQKIRDAGAMDVSWRLTSVAAEVLDNWPVNFYRLLHCIMARQSADDDHRFPARFGFFYTTIFRRFSEPWFAFMRNAFEDFVATHWRGALARRNTRLSRAMLERASWVPANHARNRLGVSRSRLDELVRGGQLIGEERVSDKGRRYLMVGRESMERLLPRMDDQVDLAGACHLLGLTKRRLRSVLTMLFPDAKKVEGGSNHWAISRAAIDALLRRCTAPPAHAIGTDQVCLDQVMRFWGCSEAEIAALLAAVRDGDISPVAHLQGKTGIGNLVFNAQDVRHQVARHRQAEADEWTVPEIAQMLAIKQEVAYRLVRAGLLSSESRSVGRRMAAMISRGALETFQTRYVFGRDLASLRKTSSRALQSRLAELGILPVTSGLVPPCRQALFEWTPELRQIFPQPMDAGASKSTPTLHIYRVPTNL